MSERRHEMTTKPVLLRRPGMEAVEVRERPGYGGPEGSGLHLYLPPSEGTGALRPAVVFVSGYPDPGFEAMLGCRLEQMQCYVDWARLVASAGMIGVTYANREPVADLRALLGHLREHGPALGIDATRLGLWAASGNVPTALGALMEDGGASLRAAALLYGYTLDLDGDSTVAQAAAQVGFANPTAGRGLDELPRSVSLMVVRAGGDATPGLDHALLRFLAAAEAQGRELVRIDLPDVPHAFDLLDDRPSTGEAIEAVLQHLGTHLGA